MAQNLNCNYDNSIKASMKKILLLIGLAIISFSCEKDAINRDFEDDQSVTSINGTWVVVSYEDFEKNSITRKSDVDFWNGMDVILTFTIDSLYGRNTTNIVSGNFILTERTIQITRYGGTKVGQPMWGNMFSDIIHDMESYKINNNQLRFYFNNSKNSVTLEQY
jgi:hypothetical protein